MPSEDVELATDYIRAAKHAERLAKSADPWVRELTAGNPYAPSQVLTLLASDPNPRVRSAAYRNPSGPPEASPERLSLGINSFSGASRAYTDQQKEDNASTLRSHKILRELSRHPQEVVRLDVARNPYTSSALLKDMVSDHSPNVRSAVACNPKTPRAALEGLADDISYVVQALAINPALPKDISGRLSLHRDRTIRKLIASSDNTPYLTLLLLAEDQDSEVRDAARTTLAALGTRSTQDIIPSFDITQIDASTREWTDTRPQLDALAMHAVLHLERHLGNSPTPMPHNNKGFDILTQQPDGRHRFLEVKAIGPTAVSVTVTRNQIELAAKAGDDFSLAIVSTDGATAQEIHYVATPYPGTLPDTVAAIAFDVAKLKEQGSLKFRRTRATFGDSLTTPFSPLFAQPSSLE